MRAADEGLDPLCGRSAELLNARSCRDHGAPVPDVGEADNPGGHSTREIKPNSDHHDRGSGQEAAEVFYRVIDAGQARSPQYRSPRALLTLRSALHRLRIEIGDWTRKETPEAQLGRLNPAMRSGVNVYARMTHFFPWFDAGGDLYEPAGLVIGANRALAANFLPS